MSAVSVRTRRKDQIMSMNGTAGQVDVVIVGAGQAGLTVSYYLRAFGVEHVVLERGRAGESWRSARWDSFTLVTPNWMTRLPGYALAAGTAGEFLPRDAVVSLLGGFARGLPVQAGTEVLAVQARDRGYDVVTGAGRIAARAVVVASGGQRCPVIPALASALPADIHQSDAGQYRRPGLLPPGAVLVVGSGQSGAQIAADLAAAGREVLLATSRVPRVPRRYRGRDIHEWAVELGLYDQPAEAVTDPAEFRQPHPMLSGAHGGQTLAYQQLARDGVRLLGRLAAAEGHALTFGPDLPRNVEYADQAAEQFRRSVDEYVARAGMAAPPPGTDPAERPESASGPAPRTLDARAERISTVLWCTGFGPDTGWLRVPVRRRDGTIEHARGVTAFPGLYVAGFPWLSDRGSGLLYGVAADSARIAQHIAMAARGRADQAIRHLVSPAGRQPS
jgi:putative flavoprotein involved in K+ transport